MEEEIGLAIIHHAQYHSNDKRFQNRRDEPQNEEGKTDLSNCKYNDVKCQLCQTYGHVKMQCDRMSAYGFI